MKIFDGDFDKVNFVDENNVFVGYDLLQDCCEDANWFIADREIDGIKETEALMLEGLARRRRSPYHPDEETRYLTAQDD